VQICENDGRIAPVTNRKDGKQIAVSKKHKGLIKKGGAWGMKGGAYSEEQLVGREYAEDSGGGWPQSDGRILVPQMEASITRLSKVGSNLGERKVSEAASKGLGGRPWVPLGHWVLSGNCPRGGGSRPYLEDAAGQRIMG